MNALQVNISKLSDEDGDASLLDAMRNELSSEERDALLLDALKAVGEQSEAKSANSCHSGLVGMLMQKGGQAAANCINPCTGSCPTLNTLLTTYMTRGGQPAMVKEACKSHNKHGLQCFFGHIGPCRPLISKAASFGVHIPTSSGELNGMCR